MIQTYRQKITEMRAEQRLLEDQLQGEEAVVQALVTGLEELEESRAIIQEAAIKTQDNLRVHLSSIVTEALQAVFGDKYTFSVIFETKRGKTECILQFETKRGHFLDPMEDNGGGAIDIASFALRASFWALNKTQPVLILDEPLKFLSKDLVPIAAEMMRMIAEELGLQVIMVSHIPEFIDQAAKVTKIKQVTEEGWEVAKIL